MIFPYEEQSRVAVLPISLTYAKEYLHIDPTNTAHDTTITRMLTAARDFFEGFTNNSLTEITYKTYRATFAIGCFEIRKTPLMSIESVKYFDEDDVLQTIAPADYFINPVNGYDFLLFKNAFVVPTLSDDVGWPIEIIFKSGFTSVPDEIPEDIADGLLAHLAKMFKNRGDAYEFGGGSVTNTVSRKFVPRTTMLAYKKYIVEEIGG